MSTAPQRRSTPTVDVDGVKVGSAHPVVVQSMTNTDTADPDATAIQVARLAHAGSQLVRVTVNTPEAAAAVPEMVRKVRGLGVVGEQPLLRPSESFQYTSGTAIATPVGTMRGSYHMVAEDGVEFDAPIPEFTLSMPRVLH